VITLPFFKKKGTPTTGARVEQAAAQLVAKSGMTVVARNYTCRLGEIDIIAQKDDLLVFIEVRYRKQVKFGSGAESVTLAKQRKIIKAAQWYLQHTWPSAEPACRFDVIAVTGEPLQFDWIPHAFEVQEWN
jgi:putative endonuclease